MMAPVVIIATVNKYCGKTVMYLLSVSSTFIVGCMYYTSTIT